MKVRVTTIGNSAGVVLPRETQTKLRVERGDSRSVVETPDGARPTTCEPAFEEEMEATRKITRRYRNASRTLAK